MNVDGTLILTPVEVGLVDYANAEILNGLSIGDVVSTGNVETKSSTINRNSRIDQSLQGIG